MILADLQDPGNFGAILRTAQALGVDGVFACGCPELYAPKVLRAAMGGIFRLNVVEEPDAGAVIRRIRNAGPPVWAAALNGEARTPAQLGFSGGCGVVIGNEGKGLPQELIDACDGAVRIPMRADANSLNAAAAASILLWEMTRERLE